MNKRTALESIILEKKYDIMVLTETWLKKPISIPTRDYKVIDNLSDSRHM